MWTLIKAPHVGMREARRNFAALLSADHATAILRFGKTAAILVPVPGHDSWSDAETAKARKVAAARFREVLPGSVPSE